MRGSVIVEAGNGHSLADVLHMTRSQPDSGPDSTLLRLSLLGDFRVEQDVAGAVQIASVGRLLLAILALNGGSAHRSRVVGTIWPDKSEQRGLANLRAARWRLPEPLRSNVIKQGASIALTDQWQVDVDQVNACARQIHDTGRIVGLQRDIFATDLLPEWDFPWLLILREQHRQMRLHALESLALAEMAQNRPLDAVDTAMAAVAAEPLRESAHMVLLRAHIAAGNRARCFQVYRDFSARLKREIGVEPSPKMKALVQTAGFEESE